jgi:ubiquinone/menaquinone biosynthesis C-methylase UbiE
MNPNKALWEKGDFTAIAAFMRESGESIARSLAVKPPLKVLDLGCGDGTTALPMAQAGADVTGIDIASNLVAAGNRRAAKAGLTNLRFKEGDACNLEGVPDASFDLTLSVFGAMFAPKPFDVAKEMVRVTKPGGRIVMGNWIPNDPTSFVSQLLKTSAAYSQPPPEGFVSPMTWGVDTHILERFGKAGVPAASITMTKDTYVFIGAETTPEQYIDLFTRYYGPTMNAIEARAREREGARAAQRAGEAGEVIQHGQRTRRLDPGDVHAGDRGEVTWQDGPGSRPRVQCCSWRARRCAPHRRPRRQARPLLTSRPCPKPGPHRTSPHSARGRTTTSR